MSTGIKKPKGKPYNRTLHSGEALILIALYQLGKTHEDGWVHISEYERPSHEEGRMANLWGLVEVDRNTKKDGNPRTGKHRLTELGRRFVLGQVSVAKVVVETKSIPLYRSEERVTIEQVLGDKFDYNKLMGR